MSTMHIMAQMITVFQVFRAAVVSAVECLITLAPVVTGGLLRSIHPSTPGTVTCHTTPAPWAWTTSLITMVFLFVVSGIRTLWQFDYFFYYPALRGWKLWHYTMICLFTPWDKNYFEGCSNQQDATKREKYLKTAWGKRYIKSRLNNYLTGWIKPATIYCLKYFNLQRVLAGSTNLPR